MEEALAKSTTRIKLDFEEHVKTKLSLDIDGDGPTTEICRLFLRGMCPKGVACPQRHTFSTLRFASEKTVVCKHWLRGLCKKGDACEFLHEYNLKRMPECFFFAQYGECSNPECIYLHIDPNAKVRQCQWYARGFCKHGPNCRNKHVRNTACPLYLSGFCPFGSDCQFGHPKGELPQLAATL